MFLIRADASNIIGSGHLKRAKNLSNYLSNNNIKHSIYCRNLEGSRLILKKFNFKFKFLNQNIDIMFEKKPIENSSFKKEIELIKSIKQNHRYIIYDTKYFNEFLFKELSRFIKVILINDSLINYNYVFLNLYQRYYGHKRLPNSNFKYKDLLILSKEIRNNIKTQISTIKSKKKILIFFGNSDNKNITEFFLDNYPFNENNMSQIHLILGASNKNASTIKKKYKNKVKIIKFLNKFNSQIKKYDLLYTSTGVTMTESIMQKIPSFIISNNSNQEKIAKYYNKKRYIHYCDSIENLITNQSKFKKQVKLFEKDIFLSIQKNLIESNFNYYGTENFFNYLLNKTTNKIALKKLTKKDLYTLFYWVNDNDVIENSKKKKKIDFDKHQIWFQKAISSNKNYIFILYLNNVPIGQTRFDLIKKDTYLITFSIDKLYRNKGYGDIIIKKSLIKLFSQNVTKKLIAQVKPKNLSSIKIFEKNGFKFDKIVEGLLQFKKNI